MGSCFCCKGQTEEEKKNTIVLKNSNTNNDNKNINSNKPENDVDKYASKEELEKIKKIQSFYRSKNSILLPKTTISKITELKKENQDFKDKYEKIQLVNEQLKMEIEDLKSQKTGLKKEATKLNENFKEINKEKDTLLKNNKDLENAKLQITQEMELLKKQLENARSECTETKNKNSQLMLKYQSLSLAKKYAEEKQIMIDELKKNQDTLQTENNMLKEKCNHLLEAIRLSNINRTVSVPLSLNKIKVKSNNDIRNIKTDVKNTTTNKYINKTTNIYSKNKNKDNDTTDKNVNQTSIYTQVKNDAQSNKKHNDFISNQTNTINFFNKITNKTTNEKINFNGKIKDIVSFLNNKKTKTENLQNQNNDFSYSKKNTNNSKIINVSNKQELFFNKI